MQTVPRIFTKCRSEFTETRHFKQIFLWEWASPVRGYPLPTPYSSPQPSLLDAPMRPRRIPASFTRVLLTNKLPSDNRCTLLQRALHDCSAPCDSLYLLVLVDVAGRVQCELLLPHSRSRRFLNVFTVLALIPHCLVARSSGVQLSD